MVSAKQAAEAGLWPELFIRESREGAEHDMGESAYPISETVEEDVDVTQEVTVYGVYKLQRIVRARKVTRIEEVN